MATQAETIAAIGPYLPGISLSLLVLIYVFFKLVEMRIINLTSADGWETPNVGQVWMMYHPGGQSQEILKKKAVGHCYKFVTDLMPYGITLEPHEWWITQVTDAAVEYECTRSFDGLYTNSMEYAKQRAEYLQKVNDELKQKILTKKKTNDELYEGMMVKKRAEEKKTSVQIATTRSKDEIKNDSIKDEYVSTNIIKEKMLKFLLRFGKKGKGQSIYSEDEKDEHGPEL